MRERRPIVTTYLEWGPSADAPVVTWALCQCGEVLFSDASQREVADRQKPVAYFICPRCYHRVDPKSRASRRLRRDAA